MHASRLATLAAQTWTRASGAHTASAGIAIAADAPFGLQPVEEGLNDSPFLDADLASNDLKGSVKRGVVRD